MNSIQTPSKKLRQGSYCLIIDPKTKQIIVEDSGAIPGGGINSGETAIQACIREIAEETNNQIIINPDNLYFFKEVSFERNFKEVIIRQGRKLEFDWNGKAMQIFVYLINLKDFIDFEYFNEDCNRSSKMSWMSFDDFFAQTKRVDRVELEKFLTTIR